MHPLGAWVAMAIVFDRSISLGAKLQPRSTMHEGELTVLAAKHGVGAPGASFEIVPEGTMVITMQRLRSDDGWDTFEAWGSDLPDPNSEAMAASIRAFVDKLWASPLRASSGPEWHTGNIMYNNKTGEILRIDWDPVEGGCSVGDPEVCQNMLRKKEDYVKAIAAAASEARKKQPKPTPPCNDTFTKVVRPVASTKLSSAPRPSAKRRRRAVEGSSVRPLIFEGGFVDGCAGGYV